MLFVSSYWMCESIPILIASYFERHHFVKHHYCGITVEEMVPDFIKIRPMLKKQNLHRLWNPDNARLLKYLKRFLTRFIILKYKGSRYEND